jgi:REP element-mobilizing transposase RayT
MLRETDQQMVPGQYYHIYNRGNNGEDIFLEARNYVYFLKLYHKHVSPIAETYAYCLLKNHFHFLVRIKDESDLTGFQNLSGLALKLHLPFSHFFNAYTKAINKTYGRTGSLFERPFKRILITNESHLLYLVTYIHQNPQRHGLVTGFSKWLYSSYSKITSGEVAFLQVREVLSWFGGLHDFLETHQTFVDFAGIEG